MRVLPLLLLLALSLSSFAAPVQVVQFIYPSQEIPEHLKTGKHVLLDPSLLTHLKCEWRGVGKRCKSGDALQKESDVSYFEFQDNEESDEELLERIKTRHPLNTFKILNTVEHPEMCKDRRLWCNVALQIVTEDHQQAPFDSLQDLARGSAPIVILAPPSFSSERSKVEEEEDDFFRLRI